MIGLLLRPWPRHPTGMRIVHFPSDGVVCLAHAWPQCPHLLWTFLSGTLAVWHVRIYDL